MKTTGKVKILPNLKVLYWVRVGFCLLVCVAFFSLGGLAQQPEKTKLPRSDLQIERRRLIPQDIREMQQVTVPTLIGLPHNRERLEGYLRRYNLLLGESLPQPNNDSLGLIIRQWPEPGKLVTPPVVVNVAFAIEMPLESTPPPQLITVPSYIGLLDNQVISLLQNSRLMLGEQTEVFADERPGIVVGQFPRPGMEVNPGTRIDLQISLGPVPEMRIEVPSIIGKGHNRWELAVILEEFGLHLGESLPVINNDSVGLVTRQWPAAGERVEPQARVDVAFGIEIRIETPSQPDLVRVPRYIEMTVERAIANIDNDRLSPGERSEVFANAPPGIVVNQFPEPDMEVAPGTRVHMQISVGPMPETRVKVPLLIGRSLYEATLLIREATLTFGNLTEIHSEEMVGMVLEQSPTAGAMVVENTPVDLVLSAGEILVIVPYVLSLHPNDAIRKLKEAGLHHHFYYEKASGKVENTILGQEPLAGTSVRIGSVIYLDIAKNRLIPPWIYWTGAIVFAGLIGGFSGRFLKSKQNQSAFGQQNPKVKFKSDWDMGKQKIVHNYDSLVLNELRLKYSSDTGIQNVKTN